MQECLPTRRGSLPLSACQSTCFARQSAPAPAPATPPRPPHQPGCPRNLNGYNKSDVSPHTLRRTFGSHLLNHGLRLEVVSKLLGHSTTTITEQAYAQLLDDTTRRELLHALQHPTNNHHAG